MEQPQRSEERMQRKELLSGKKEGKNFVNKDGARALHWQGDQIEQWRYKCWRAPKKIAVFEGKGSPEAERTVT